MTDLQRYARQLVLPAIGVNGQQQLLDASILVVGAGGLGSVAAAYLAGAGIGRLVIADRDRVELSNLQRQILYRYADIGRRKSEAAVQQLRAINPDIDIVPQDGTLTPDVLADRVADADAVLDCSDNFRTRLDVNAACVEARTPLISGAAIRFDGQLLLVDPAREDCPCYACWFGTDPGTDDRCEDAGVLGPVVGSIGTQQALLAILQILGLADCAGVLQQWNARRLEWRRVRGRRDPACPVCGGNG